MKNMLATGKLASLVVASALAFAPSLSGAVSMPKVEVKPNIVVAGPRVDASCLLGKRPSEDLRRQLEKVPIGVISRPLGELQLKREDLEKQLGHLSQHLELPRQVKILRLGDLLPKRDLEEKIRSLCVARSDDPTRVEVDMGRIPDHIVLPGPLTRWDVQPVSTNVYGMVLLNLVAECATGMHKQIIQVEVSRVVQAAKVKRLLKRGEIIGEEYVTRETVRVRGFAHQNYAEFNDIIGKQLISIKSPGSYLKNQDINSEISITALRPSPTMKGKSCSRDAWTIKPGERVQFHVQSGGLSLTVPAKALEGGCVGDSILLVNLQNNRNIFGTISGEGRVDHAAK